MINRTFYKKDHKVNLRERIKSLDFSDKVKLDFALGERSFQRKIGNMTFGSKFQLSLDENLNLKKFATDTKELYQQVTEMNLEPKKLYHELNVENKTFSKKYRTIKNGGKSNNPALENNAISHIIEEYQKRGLEKIPKFNAEANNIFKNSLMLEENAKIKQHVNANVKNPVKLNKEIVFLQHFQEVVKQKQKDFKTEVDIPERKEKKISSLLMSKEQREEIELQEILKKTDRQILTAMATYKKENRRLKHFIKKDAEDYKKEREETAERERQKILEQEEKDRLKSIELPSPTASPASIKKFNQTTHTNATNHTKDNTKTNFYSVSPKSTFKVIDSQTPGTRIRGLPIKFKPSSRLNKVENMTAEENTVPMLTLNNLKLDLEDKNEKKEISIDEENELSWNRRLKTIGNSQNITKKTKLSGVQFKTSAKHYTTSYKNNQTEGNSNTGKVEKTSDIHQIFFDTPNLKADRLNNFIEIKQANKSPIKIIAEKRDKKKQEHRSAVKKYNVVVKDEDKRICLSKLLDLGGESFDARREQISNIFHGLERKEDFDEKDVIFKYLVDYLDMDRATLEVEFKNRVTAAEILNGITNMKKRVKSFDINNAYEDFAFNIGTLDLNHHTLKKAKKIDKKITYLDFLLIRSLMKNDLTKTDDNKN